MMLSTEALLNAELTASQLDAGMHTGKEGTEAMPYFDTFDLETIDILLISQYVLPFPFPLDQYADKDLEKGVLGIVCGTDFEDEHDNSERQQSLHENCSSCPLGIPNRSNCTIRADKQYKPVQQCTISVF
jgi:hypothetical protein